MGPWWNAADTEFHIWEIKQEGRSHNGNPYSTVYADGVELANNQNSNNWWFHPGQLSFGGWAELSETSNCQVAEFLIFRGLKPDDDRYLIEGYLAHKWGIDLPSNHPWVNEKPTFGEKVLDDGPFKSTPVGVTTSTMQPIVRNREPANLKKNSATLTGQLVDAGLGMVPSDPANAQFSPQHYPGLRLWLDVSDADGDGTLGSDYDDQIVTPPGQWNPGVLAPALWLDASELTSADSNWADKGPNGNDATRHGSPVVVSGVYENPVMRYNGTNGQYHSFPQFSNIRTVFWVYKDMGGSYFMLGDDNQYHFHKGITNMFEGGWTQPIS